MVSQIALARPDGSGGYSWTSVYPATDTAARQIHEIVESNLWPSQAIADEIAPTALAQMNKGSRGISHLCRLDPFATQGIVGRNVPADPSIPAMFIESLEMILGPGQHMTVAGVMGDEYEPPT